MERSDSDSEQSAQLAPNFAGILQQHKYGVPDYRILTAGYNETALGEWWLPSYMRSPQHASVGNET